MTDFVQKRPSVGAIDDDPDSKSGVLGLLNKKLGRSSKKLPDGVSAASADGKPANGSQSTNSAHSKVPSLNVKTPLSARDSDAKRVPSLALPGTSSSLAELPEHYGHSPGRPAPAKKTDMADKSLNASTTSLAMRKLFLGKVESQQTDDFALWKQFRDLEPDFSQEVNSTTPFPFLKVAPPSEDDEQDEQRDSAPDLLAGSVVVEELVAPKEDVHDVSYEQWCQQMMNLIQLHKQELNTSKYNEASTPRSARVQNSLLELRNGT